MFFYLFAENFIFGEFSEELYTYLAGLAAVEVSKISRALSLVPLLQAVDFCLLRSDAGRDEPG
jgi:hypothetical protein